MIRFLIRRFLSGLVVLFIFVTVIFFLVQIIIPGDYVSQFSLTFSPSEAEALRHQLGLDLPIWQRYLIWLDGLLHGDLGRSYTLAGKGAPIFETLKPVIPPSVLVFGIGTVIAFLLGLWLGKVTAWRGPGFLSSSATFGAITLYTSFPPWLAFLAVYFFVTRMGLFSIGFTRTLWQSKPVTPSGVMWIMVISFAIILLALFFINLIIQRISRRSLPSSVILILLLVAWLVSFYKLGILAYAVDVLKAAALPLITYVLLSFGEIMLIMRTTMTDVMHEEYVHTAQAKGLPDYQIRDRHVARNALLPVISGLVIRLPYLLTGSVMIESSLDWAGLGSTLFYAVGRQNILMVMALAIIFGLVSLVARLILDVAHAYLDPRVRFDSQLIRKFI
jgi:peptide/nickel transport system permease protein